MKTFPIPYTVLIVTACSLCACDGEGDAARAELQKAEAACKKGDSDKARDIMSKAAAENETFGDAWSFATSGMPDKQYIKPCGPVLNQLKARLEE